jgi:hypothetical protein
METLAKGDMIGIGRVTVTPESRSPPNAKRPKPKFGPFLNLERETSLELATSTLARLRSTN